MSKGLIDGWGKGKKNLDDLNEKELEEINATLKKYQRWDNDMKENDKRRYQQGERVSEITGLIIIIIILVVVFKDYLFN